MKGKILEDAMKWYESKGKNPDIYVEDFIDLVVDKTVDSIFEKVKSELKQEFDKGTLKHDFFISSDYYLELKLKEIKQKCMKNAPKNETGPDNEL